MPDPIPYPPTAVQRPWDACVTLPHMVTAHGYSEDQRNWAHDQLHKLPYTPQHNHRPVDLSLAGNYDHELRAHRLPPNAGWDWLHQVCFPECDANLTEADLREIAASTYAADEVQA